MRRLLEQGIYIYIYLLSCHYGEAQVTPGLLQGFLYHGLSYVLVPYVLDCIIPYDFPVDNYTPFLLICRDL